VSTATGEALARMPHEGRMLLLASVEAHDPTTIRARAADHRGADFPLRRGGRLDPLALVELGAQAAAAHASLHALRAAHVGLLIGLARIEAGPVAPDDAPAPLTVAAERLPGEGPAARYRFAVLAETGTVVSGEAMLRMEPAP